MKFYVYLINFLLLMVMLILKCNCDVYINEEKEADSYRLLDNIKVDNYNIWMKLNKDFKTFSGRVTIKFRTQYQSNIFKFNYYKLNGLNNFSNYKFDELNEDGITMKTKEIAMINLDAKRDICTLTLKSYVPANRLIKFIIYNFQGRLSNGLRGFYKSVYGNDRRIVASTHFEPTYARRAFPCFDEPTFKATFDFSMTIPNVDGYSCLFNTKKINETVDGDYRTYMFDTTPVMSSYLVAFVVSDFLNVTDYLRNKPFSIWTSKNERSNGNFPARESTKILNAYEEFTNINFLLNKMDEVAVPELEPGAMENWGLVTFKNNLLLYNVSESSSIHKKEILEVIAHEFAHQWFGNLVTCDWWSNLWLNEGFASYMTPYILAKVYPEFQSDSLFILEDRQNAMLKDAEMFSLPLSSKEDAIYTLDQINSHFGRITYSKGGHVIRMLEKFIGINNFISAIRKYLDANRYKNSNPNMLLSYFTTKSPRGAAEYPATVIEIMQNWIYNNGFPVLNVTRNANDVIITQHRFLLNNNEQSQITSSTEWYVPISYTSLDRGDYETTYAKSWLIPGETLTLRNVFDYYNNGLILNVQASGFYITNYDDELLSSIKNVLKRNHESVHVNNRIQLIFDTMTLARGRQISYRVALKLIDYIENERNYFPLSAALNGLNHLLKMLGETSVIGLRLMNHITDLLRNIFKNFKFGIIDSDLIEAKKQILITDWASKLYISDCMDMSLELFDDYMNGYTVPIDLRKIVFKTAAKNDKNYWFMMDKALRSSKDIAERDDFIYGMSGINDKDQLIYFLDQTINPTHLSSDEINNLFANVASNPEGVDAILEFNVARWQDMFKSNLNVVNTIQLIIDSIRTPKQLGLLGILLQNSQIANKATANSIWQTVGNNQKWRTEVTIEIENYFETKFDLLELLLG